MVSGLAEMEKRMQGEMGNSRLSLGICGRGSTIGKIRRVKKFFTHEVTG